MMLAGCGLLLTGAFAAGLGADERWVRAIFGGLALSLGGMDALRFSKPPKDKRAWLFLHMTRFLSAAPPWRPWRGYRPI